MGPSDVAGVMVLWVEASLLLKMSFPNSLRRNVFRKSGSLGAGGAKSVWLLQPRSPSIPGLKQGKCIFISRTS